MKPRASEARPPRQSGAKWCPGLDRLLQGVLADKPPWGTLLFGIGAYAASKYALGWDQSTDELVTGLGVLAASYAMRVVTACPISGLFKKTPVAAPAPVASAPSA